MRADGWTCFHVYERRGLPRRGKNGWWVSGDGERQRLIRWIGNRAHNGRHGPDFEVVHLSVDEIERMRNGHVDGEYARRALRMRPITTAACNP